MLSRARTRARQAEQGHYGGPSQPASLLHVLWHPELAVERLLDRVLAQQRQAEVSRARWRDGGLPGGGRTGDQHVGPCGGHVAEPATDAPAGLFLPRKTGVGDRASHSTLTVMARLRG